MKYLIVVEDTTNGFSAYSPDLPGCVATGSTRADVEMAMEKAIKFHIDGLRAEELEIPMPHSYSAYVELTT